MKITICDACRKHDAKLRCFIYDREADAAGGMSSVSYDVDLCESCLLRAHELLIKKIIAQPKGIIYSAYIINSMLKEIIEAIIDANK
jgi:hypothetical protein